MTTQTARVSHIPYADISRRLVAAHKRRDNAAKGAAATKPRR